MQNAQAVQPRQEQIEQHEVVRVALCALEPLATVARAVDRKALGLQSSCQETEDSRLVLDHQNPHTHDHNRPCDDMKMTPR